MSIPKEPRQLMINLMYLVLTAMLALNVSAEIINAFFALEKGIKDSSTIVDGQNKNLMTGIKDAVSKTPKYAEWQEKAQKVQAISTEFESFINGIRDEVFTAAGGPHPEHPDRPKNYKDKDVTTRLLVDEGKGKLIEDKIKETKEKLLTIFDKADLEKYSSQLPLTVDEIAHDSDAKTWAEYKFKQMPVAAVMPIFAKILSDAKTSTSTALNYCFEKTSGRIEIKLDKYLVAINPKKAYLISGKDRFEAEVAMGAYSSTNNNISITGNGQGLSVREGKAQYSGGVESGTGERTFRATATITNPATGEKQTVSSELKYEVGQASCAVAADKMNVFYIGVDNPISVAAAGASSNALRVNINGGGGSISGSGKSYTVRVNSPGQCTITVTAPEMNASFPFRVKRIPDPAPTLGGRMKGGGVGNGEFKAQDGLIAVLDNFDFEAKCSITGFTLVKIPKRADVLTTDVDGARFDSKARNLIDSAKPGDKYGFEDIRARCPGDAASRAIGSLSFTIK